MFAPAQPECLERGAPVTYVREVTAGLRPAGGGPRVTTIVAETAKAISICKFKGPCSQRTVLSMVD